MSGRREMVRSASRTLGRLATAGLFAAGSIALSADAVSAHPLGNLSVNRATEVVVTPDAVRVLRVVDSAEIPTVQLKAQLADLPGYAASACAEEASTLRLEVRGSVASLVPAASAASLLPGQAGLRTLRLECRYLARTAVAEGTAIRVVEGSTRIAVGWREIVIRADGLALRSSDAPSTSPTSLLTRYPDDALASPSDQSTAEAVAGPASAPAATADQPTSRAAFRPVDTLAAAADRLVSGSASPAALALLAATAFALGAAHALAPGHGKTVMAFYLVGRERRSLLSAAAVVGTVTVTHTSTVLLLGLLIGLGTAVAPAAVTLWAGVVSGLLVAAAGAALVVRAWRSRRLDRHDGHVHAHGHAHGHAHSHGHGHVDSQGLEHAHTPAHDHAHPHGHGDEAVREHRAGRGVLVSLGAAGGLVPSPSALLLLLGAVAAGRAFLGVGLVVLFGLGMAATLAAVSGIALGLRARLDGVGGHLGRLWHPVSRLMPVSSGAVICLIGLGMATRGLGAAIA